MSECGRLVVVYSLPVSRPVVVQCILWVMPLMPALFSRVEVVSPVMLMC